MSRLAGKVAVVTGTSRGIGRVIADRLEEEDARVVGLARTVQPRRTPTRMDLPCDITSSDAVQTAIAAAVEAFGPPDIVVNNAGAFLLKPLEATSNAEFAAQLGTNVFGPFYVLRALVPLLRERPGAHIVTIGSVADHRPYVGNAAYGAGKYAARGLHEVVREELRGTSVRMTLISPGATDTRVWDEVGAGTRSDVLPRAAMLHPSDVADAVLYAVCQPPRVAVEWIRIVPASA
jgi:NADP-dependent 3-hydroxy acid dehydrogenase YdfG